MLYCTYVNADMKLAWGNDTDNMHVVFRNERVVTCTCIYIVMRINLRRRNPFFTCGWEK